MLDAAPIMTRVSVPDCLAHTSGLRHSRRTPRRLSASVASASRESVWCVCDTTPALHSRPWNKRMTCSRNFTACMRTPSLVRSASMSARTSSWMPRAARHISATCAGTPGPPPRVAAWMSAWRKMAAPLFTAVLTTIGTASLSSVRTAPTHGAMCSGWLTAICSHMTATILRTAVWGSTCSSSKGCRKTCSRLGSLRSTSSCSALRCAVAVAASVASLALLSNSTACECAQLCCCCCC
mmetsp:Transcript_9110/g.22440  ORF Transcript_9110/g.22440 Transcript_9110/m.22440 type:complete len:238 (+) Transcript_9110:82-795(+)